MYTRSRTSIVTGTPESAWFVVPGDETPEDELVIKNRLYTTTIKCKTAVDERYKLMVYDDRGYGGLLDLREDYDEVQNLWDDLITANPSTN